MNHKSSGFTLVELIAIIVIISLLVTLSSTLFINVRFSILEKDYENLVTYIETKAIEYANKTGNNLVNVDTLIKKGYISPDDDSGNIYNPKDKSRLNCNTISLKLENGEYSATFNEDGINNTDGEECIPPKESSDYKICKIDGNDCLDISSDSWFKDDVTLGVRKENGDPIAAGTYYWQSNTGQTSNEATIKTSTSVITQSTYTVQVKIDDILGKASVTVNIDKQRPIITGINILDENKWTKETKTATISFSDLNGSGVDKYYFTNTSITECSSNTNDYQPVSSDNYTANFEKGTYYFCVMDKVGNVSKPSRFEISKIDTTPTVPIITASDNVASGGWHENNFTLKFESTNVGGSNITYYYGTDPNNLNNMGNEVNISKSEVNVDYYVMACSEANLCSSINSYKVNSDTIKPTITITEGIPTTWTKKTTLKATIIDNESGVVAYALTKSSTQPADDDWTQITATATHNYVSGEISDGGSYYIWAKDRSGNTGYKLVSLYYVDSTPPKVMDITFDDTKCTSSNFTFSTSWYYDEVSSIVEESWVITSRSTQPSDSSFRSLSYSFNSLDCGVKYYAWIRAVDEAGNVGYGRSDDYYVCYACDHSDEDDDDPTPTDPSKVSYSAHEFCSNEKCLSSGYNSGTCISAQDACTGYTYFCTCCYEKDSLGNKIKWDGKGNCVGV